MELELRTALKEWAIAVSALEAGETIVLLRKGGIREESGRFTVEQRRVLLYPTYEHQKPELLKSDYAGRVQPVASGWHPETVSIGAWADITEILVLTEPEPLAAIAPLHIWNDRFATERFRWKPKSPLYVLLLRVFRLPRVQEIAYRPEYGGCRSWVELQESVSIVGSEPVLSESAYQELTQAVRDTLNGSS